MLEWSFATRLRSNSSIKHSRLATRVLFSVQGYIENNSGSFLVMGLIMSNEDCAAAAAALLRAPPLSSWVHGVCLVFVETTHLAFWDFEAPHKTAKCNL
ncbi:hypothetical protein D5086_006998 [Populus alba]|uniref:Uncharacterized protein n=1 Tax=Populus alba TaxID=43335 RepID=A0ACC4CML0_POPAL